MERLRLLVGIGLAAAAAGRATPVPAQDLSAVESSLQAVLDSVVASGSTPGITMRIDAPALGLSWSGASGVSDIETGAPLSPLNPVRIASNTKTFVAASTLRLWEDGRLGLDDPVSKHLPTAYIEMLEADGYDLEAMTVRHLLTHTSGVYDYADRERYVEAILADPMHRWTPEEQVALAMEWGEPYGPPGEIYRYSDTGYVLLAQIVEAVHGQPLATAMRALLALDTLGLRSTWMETLEEPPAGAADRAHQYLGELDTYDWDPSLDLYGGGGLASTPDDMAKFMRELFTGGVFREPATADTMLTTVSDAQPGPDLSGSPMVPGRYRMGVEVRDVGGLEVYMHTGFWGTLAAYFPGQDIAISIAVTQQQSRALFRTFIDTLTVLEDFMSGAPGQG